MALLAVGTAQTHANSTCTPVAALAAPSLPPAKWPFAGELGGILSLPRPLNSLRLNWLLCLETEGLALSLWSDGFDLRVRVSPPPSGDWAATWRWNVIDGRFDLAQLWPALRTALGTLAGDWSASGRIEVSGEGVWLPSTPSMPAGKLRVRLRDGWARSDALDLELRGIELDLATDQLAPPALPADQSLRINRLLAQGFEVSDVAIRFGLDADLRLTLAHGEARVLGGRVGVLPFTLDLNHPVFEGAVEVVSLRLAELAALMPWVVQSARGTLHGRVEIAWDAVRGLRVRDDGMNIARLDGAELRLAPAPGLFTGGQTPRFGLLPPSWGPLARFFSVNNPAYEPLLRLETGQETLRIEEMSILLRPYGPEGLHTASLRFAGRPASGRLVERVEMEVNFYGPWTDFLAFSLGRAPSVGISTATPK